MDGTASRSIVETLHTVSAPASQFVSHAETLAGAAPDAWVIPLEAGHDDGVIGQRAVSIKALQEFSTHVFGDAGR